MARIGSTAAALDGALGAATPMWWPLFGLSLTTPRLVLRPVRDEDLPGLVAAVDAGVHASDFMPFTNSWTDAPLEQRRRSTAQFHWRQRAEWSVSNWHLELAAIFESRVVGSQGIFAKDFATLKEVETGSWLTLSVQGNGLGKEMRAAVLQLAFEGLGAEVARSGAFLDNAASLGVSRALGYRENGHFRLAPRGTVRSGVRLELTRPEWEERRARLPVAEIAGLDACLGMFGAAQPGEG